MKSYNELYQKYAARSPLLPPEGEEEVVVSIPKHNKLPSIKPPSIQDMEDWEDFIAEKKLQKDLDVTREMSDLGPEEKLDQELGTIPAIPGKKQADLSPDNLLKMCSQFYNLCTKF
jgi:hypothetical protein